MGDLGLAEGLPRPTSGESHQRRQLHEYPHEEEATPLIELSQDKKELKEYIEREIDPVQKEYMEWEHKILHSTNLSFFKYKEAT